MNERQRNIKICCFCEQWESGGIESFLYNVLRQFKSEQVQVDIVVSCQRPSIFTEPLKAIGVRFFQLSGSSKKVIQNHSMFSALLEREQYDIVYLNIFHGLSLYYAKLAKEAGVPLRIAHSHNTALRKSFFFPIKQLIHRASRKYYTAFATDLWACSSEAAEFMFSKGLLHQNRFQFIPNGIETKKFQFNADMREIVRKKLGVENKFVIGNTGRLCCQKNQSFILRVFAKVHKQKPESFLLLIGDGENRLQLEKEAKKLQIRENVIFYGVSKNIEYLLWAMDIFVFPSRFEGFGIAALEAQASGLPTIISEFVPGEIHITPLCQRLKLNIDQWTKVLLNLSKENDRALYAEEVAKKGFEITDVAKEIELHFLG